MINVPPAGSYFLQRLFVWRSYLRFFCLDRLRYCGERFPKLSLLIAMVRLALFFREGSCRTAVVVLAKSTLFCTAELARFESQLAGAGSRFFA